MISYEQKLATNRAWKARNAERNKQINDERNARVQADPKLRARKLRQNRESAAKNYSKRLEYDRHRDPVKVAARNKVRDLIFRGKMERKPCEVCGKPNSHAHHEDYARPLEVKWLCPKHHKEAHAK